MVKTLIKVCASDVASLIGQHPYRKQAETFEKMASESGLLEVEDTTFVNDMMEVLQPEMKSVINSSSTNELARTITKAKETIIDIALKDVVLKQSNLPTTIKEVIQLSSESQAILSNVIRENTNNGIVDTEVVVKKISSEPIIRNDISRDDLVREAYNNIITTRGSALEESSINKFESKTGMKVTERNTKCYKCYYVDQGFLLVGKIDGLASDDSVTETKERTRIWKSPPIYDITQLRCYMKLLDKKKGYLIDNFPDGTSRTTLVEWNDDIWEKIETKLYDAINKYKETYNIK